MKTVIGVDLAGRYEPALKLCTDLSFSDQSFILVHAVEPLPAYAPPMPTERLDTHAWMEHLRKAGSAALARAEEKVASMGATFESVLASSSPTQALIGTADDLSADLIAIGSLKRSRIGGFVAGSVARAATIGARQSLLATKGGWEAKPPLKALFATDHSAYADRSLDLLLTWAPQGLKQIDVVTAFDDNEWYLPEVSIHPEQSPREMLGFHGPPSGHTSSPLFEHEGRLQSILTTEERLNEKCALVAEKLTSEGYASHAQVSRGHPNTVLGERMQALGADLLILGAQGHGFLERLFVGSVSMHQVLSEPYPVLVVRTPNTYRS